ncbi:MAG: hypothetical protein HXL41_06795 [Solobacterium sp.]|nr:hypothetical protein [Solobacterium sp.]
MTKLDTLKQQTAEMEAKLEEMKAEIDRLENGWEMKCLYKDGDEYYFVSANGLAKYDSWDNYDFEKRAFAQGNIFKTQQEAELEAKRRNLLTRFRAFRDERNNGWKPDWKDFEMKWDINYKQGEGLRELCSNNVHSFSTFGYFKNKKDAERAIELFGDEIKELFMEGE